MFLDVEKLSEILRKKVINIEEKKILISRISSSKQEHDLTLPPNCGGYARIRHFRISRKGNWTFDPLPNVPYATKMNIPIQETLQTQLFQLSACDFRCWFCFVDESLLSAKLDNSKFFTVDELFDLYFKENIQPKVIDLSGGQPNLAPEWLYWTIEKIHNMDRDDLYIWSDDNLSNYYYWKYLSDDQRKFISTFKNHGRVGCFKGFDSNSFAFNTTADPKYYDNQFDIFDRLLNEGIDMYAYAIFTAIPSHQVRKSIKIFVDRLQKIHYNLPLRTIPLEIVSYEPMKARVRKEYLDAIEFQYIVHDCWLEELEKRFSANERHTLISKIKMKSDER